MFAGQIFVPIVFKGPNIGIGGQHSQRYVACYGSCLGLKVLIPYSVEDSHGLMKDTIWRYL